MKSPRILNLPDHLTYHEEDGDEEFEVTDETMQKTAKHLSGVLNHFGKQWSKEYQLELRDVHRQKRSTSTSTSIRVGDVILVHDQDHPRGFWKMARVRKHITGRDGQTRGAVLKLPINQRQKTYHTTKTCTTHLPPRSY